MTDTINQVGAGAPAAWTRAKPTAHGAYWIRGEGEGMLARTALVEVVNFEGELWCNLHMRNTDPEFGYGYTVAQLDEAFEWLGPLSPAAPAAQGVVPEGYALVPFHPTPEMVRAAEEAHMPFGDMDIALRMAILAAAPAPNQQTEPAPAQGGREAPVVVATAILGGLFHGGSGPELGEIDIEVCTPALEALQCETVNSCDSVFLPLMTVAQHERIVAALTRPAQTEQQSVALRYTSDGELAECPCCGSLDVGGAHDTVNCYGCGLQITKPRPLQNAVDAWNKRAPIAQTAPTAAAVPEEWRVVPVEPTPEMLQAACDEEQRPLPMWSRMKAIYTAMLAAQGEGGAGDE